MKLLFALLVSTSLLLIPSAAAAQCSEAPDAGKDILLCPGGFSGVAQLDGAVPDNTLFFDWSPTAGLVGAGNLDPLAFPGNTPRTYVLTATTFDPTDNLIVNGDFALGDSGFTTEYAPGSGGIFGLISDEGEYVIDANMQATHSLFADCGDHTGGGNMMVINGSDQEGILVWCQTVTTGPQTDYVFSAWVASAFSNSPAKLQFSINGNLIGEVFDAPELTCSWRAFSSAWSSGSNTVAEICIVNLNEIFTGNDFAIDDLYFGEVCVASDTVEVLFVEAVVPASVTLSCGAAVTIDAGSSTTGEDVTYGWSGPAGGIVSGGETPVITVNTPGTYTLSVTNTADGCTETASVTVTDGRVFPVAEAGEPVTLTCSNDETVLGVVGSDQGPQYTYSWTTNGGHFVGDDSTNNPAVDSAGVYYLTIEDTTNNCSTRDSVVIAEDFVRPPANGGPDRQLTCTRLLDILGGPALTGLTYLWSSDNGSSLGGTDQSRLIVDGPGRYNLIVTDPNNGCSSTDSVSVSQNTASPVVDISPPGVLNCQNQTATLSGTSDPAYGYVWSTADGTIDGTGDGPTVTVSRPGTYTLEVTNPDNGCQSTPMISVAQDTAAPVLTLAPAAPLNCLVTQTQLTANDAGPGFSYAWSTTDGNLTATTNTPSTTADSAGTYVLTITNNANFCTATDSLAVARDARPPAGSVAPPAELDCRVDQLELAATTDLDPADRDIVWTTLNGTIAAGGATLGPTVTAAGRYELLLTNTANGCSTTVPVNVTANRTPPTAALPPTVDLGCTEADFTLALAAAGQGELRYAWSTTDGNLVSNVTTASPVIAGVGTYAVTVTDDRNGCTAQATTFADQSLLEAFVFDEQPPGCERPEGTVVFGTVDGGTPPFTYSVDDGATFRDDPVFRGLVPDNYVLVVRDANGCELEDATTFVSSPNLQLEVSPSTLIDFGESYAIEAHINFPLDRVDTVTWTPTLELSCTGCLNPVATPTQTRSYRVRVETVDGCVASALLTIIVKEVHPVYFPTAFSPNGDGVNDWFVPFAGDRTVSRIVSLGIYDRWGEEVFRAADFAPGDEPSGWDGTLNGQPMNPQVLVYVAEVEFVSGEQRAFKGDFTLVR